MTIRHVLVANRGEIACRILRSARALGYRTTAIYSEADAHSPHLALADQAVCVGPAQVGASYLNMEAILAAAKSCGADALHPGYGLLSENATFAAAVAAAGLTFVGPRAESIQKLGDKRRARLSMQAAGVPVVPGYDGEAQDAALLAREAERIGFPIMVKAAAGGGGRGLRRVSAPAELPEALDRARSEAEKAFGDGRLILERAVEGARHVEVQVFADAHGNVIHLGERDCSVQRRFQKVIEESPSPAVSPELRARMGEAAVQVAKSADYLGAGTVEFLLEPSGAFYFLEMNTRLQVEHPVTELVTGQDLVAWQFRVAEGGTLPWTQADLQLRGHAIEVRLYAEDPARNFAPATGEVLALELPESVRIDHWLAPGLRIGAHYDALLAKLIAHGPDRETARKRLCRALDELRVLGVQTNQAFLRDLLEQPRFVAGTADTRFLDTDYTPPSAAPDFATLAAAAVLFATRPHERAAYAAELAGFSNCAGLRVPCLLESAERRYALQLGRAADSGEFEVLAGDQRLCARVEPDGVLVLDGVRRRYAHAFAADTLYVHTPAGPFCLRDVTHAPATRSDAAGSGRALSPMDGAVVDVPVALGQAVVRGQTLAVVEAMKLELRVPADVDGVVRAVHVSRGAQVKARQLLVEVASG
ncbi:MAG TPA: biotin carboxylase N-terminal domain-containing protein [Polyangiales bacterium]|nr:biotin carboxylase N-terminal domain-containing protein [Polyangiales bacterium]